MSVESSLQSRTYFRSIVIRSISYHIKQISAWSSYLKYDFIHRTFAITLEKVGWRTSTNSRRTSVGGRYVFHGSKGSFEGNARMKSFLICGWTKIIEVSRSANFTQLKKLPSTRSILFLIYISDLFCCINILKIILTKLTLYCLLFLLKKHLPGFVEKKLTKKLIHKVCSCICTRPLAWVNIWTVALTNNFRSIKITLSAELVFSRSHHHWKIPTIFKYEETQYYY